MRLHDRAGNQKKLRSLFARRGSGVLLVALACVAGRALAQPADVPRVQYEASDGCPTQSEFLARMRARMDADGTRAPADIALRITLTVHGDGGTTQGSAEISRGATITRRAVAGRRCEEVADALALIAALAVRDAAPRSRARKPDKNNAAPRARGPETKRAARSDPAAGGAPPGASEAAPAAGTTSDDDPGSADEQADRTRESGIAPPRDRVAGRELGASIAGAGTSEARSGPPARARAAESGRAAPLSEEEADKAAEPRDAAGGPSFRLGATALLFSGLAPALQPGMQLQAAVALRAGALVWSLQLGGRLARSDSVASPDGDARLGFAGGVVRLCVARALGPTPLTLTGCAVAEPGVYSAAGDNTRNRRSHSRLWLAAGAAADVSIELASWLHLRAGAELLAPFRRDRIWLAADTLYRIPALGFRWHLGLEVPFG